MARCLPGLVWAATAGNCPCSGWAGNPLIRLVEFMAKKTRKQKQRAPARRAVSPATAPRTGAPSAPATRAVSPLQVLPESVEPLPGSGGRVESEPDDDSLDGSSPEDGSVATDTSARRRVERLNPMAQPRSASRQVSTAAMFLPLDSDDAAIPFDRVPYVPRDLRRVAIMASLMIVLILIAAFVVTRFNL